MDCKTVQNLLPLYFDGELDRATGREVEAHLDACADCRAVLIELDALRRTLRTEAPRFTAPASLRARIAAEPTSSTAARRRSPQARWLAVAASCALAFLAGGVLLPLLTPPREAAQTSLAHDLFASHWRALAAASPVDIVSTDRHTVKPWFAGKIAQAPPVHDFVDRGFALVGGRIDYAGSERIAVLVYRHGQHLIDVFVLPRDHVAATSEQQGYFLEPLVLDGQAAAMVSDMDAAERRHFLQVLREAGDTPATSR